MQISIIRIVKIIAIETNPSPQLSTQP